MNDDEIMKKIEDETNLWYALACDEYGLTYKPLTVKFDLKGEVAGMACLMERKIRYNLILARDNFETFVARTVPHEVAHIICDRKYPLERGHGKYWKSVMVKLGVKDISRCHSYDTSNVKTGRKQYSYKCSGCGHILSVGKNIHSKLQAGERRWHKGCEKTQLIYIPD